MNLYDCRDLVVELNSEFEKYTYNSKFVPYTLEVTSEHFAIIFLGQTLWRESHFLTTALLTDYVKEFVLKEAFYLLNDIDIYYTYLKEM